MSGVEKRRLREVGGVQGLYFVRGFSNCPFPDSPLHLNVETAATAGGWISVPTTLGFYVGSWKSRPESFFIILPLWLPTLGLAGLNAFVWRKARRRMPRRPFPVEPAKKAEG